MKKLALLLACLMLGMALLASCGGSESSEKEYVPGDISGTTYSSDWLGLTFTPTSNMVMMTEDELYEMMDLGAEVMGTDKTKVEWAKMVTVYEMMASDIITGNNVILMTEKLTAKSITMDQYIEALKSQFSTQLGASAMQYEEISETPIAGQKYTRFAYEMTVSGTTVSQVMFLRKVDNRMVAICVTTVTDGAEQAFINCFSAK